ncbi:MAG: hypothetical protein L6R39_002504 [Caloplaca ligustica]|nr:MAG: hypothetical protein L6R39_002504 [Caloplaca ligustica]
MYPISLLLLIKFVSCNPLASPSPIEPSAGSLQKIDVAVSKPPKPPICPPDLSPRPGWTRFFGRDCEAAIAQIPRDVRPASPPRNFYLLAQDENPYMPNVQLPLEYEYGECKVQLLMSSTFMDVPHDQATWMDVWGPARLILQQCAIKQRTGGIITNIGQNEKMDLVIYGKSSLYGKSRRIDRSKDPVAEDIAKTEFLQILGILPHHIGEGLDAATNGTAAVNGTDETGAVAGTGETDEGATSTA